MELHTSGEDYLKAIYLLQQEKGYVRSMDVAERVGVSNPSVSHAIKLLREGGFIVIDDDYALHLTELGQEIAEKLYERHQYFMKQFTGAGVDASTAEAEACKMKHTISDNSFQKLKGQEQKLCPFADTCDLKPAMKEDPDLRWLDRKKG
jgi:Mn-dependent DtxR family transcriptional regulator